MNNHQKGYRRVREIVEAVERCGVLDAEQIERLIYPGVKSGKRQAQRKLKKLYEAKRLKRDRLAIDEPYHYYTAKMQQTKHRLATNWIYLWMLNNLKNWETLHSFEYEPDYKILRADALASVKNKVTGKFLFYFVEADLSTGNPFDKVKKYNDLYASERYAGSWWVKIADRFPAVIVATESESRLRTIQRAVDEENVHGLEFRVYLLDHLKEVCRGCPASLTLH